ncbi:MAG: phosphoribosyltransferase [Burkholderiales bacterium]|nr:phosphoribosyltransferase [Burkholderiales bacterium]
MDLRYQNRREAGEFLARKLSAYADRAEVIVIGLPRGGLPVAYVVAERLHVELDVLQVRKLGIPGNEELIMGAVTEDGVCALRPEIAASSNIPAEVIEAAAQREQRKMMRQARLYRSSKPEPILRDRIAIVVDDGLETGATMQAAVRALRHRHAAQIVVGLPVATKASIEELRPEVDGIICLSMPEAFSSIAQYYDDFSEVSDEDVRKYLVEAEQWHMPTAGESGARPRAASYPTVPR